jgi:hypothetical protein
MKGSVECLSLCGSQVAGMLGQGGATGVFLTNSSGCEELMYGK